MQRLSLIDSRNARKTDESLASWETGRRLISLYMQSEAFIEARQMVQNMRERFGHYTEISATLDDLQNNRISGQAKAKQYERAEPYCILRSEAAPISFDFSVFLYYENQRRQLEAESLRVVIVPGSKGGFRREDAGYEIDTEMALQNIVVPLTTLLEIDVSLDVCGSREAAKEIEDALAGRYFLKLHGKRTHFRIFSLVCSGGSHARKPASNTYRPHSGTHTCGTGYIAI